MTMTTDEVVIGQTYLMKHTSGYIHVRINDRIEKKGYSARSRKTSNWVATNLKTGREITIKSASRLSLIAPDTVSDDEGIIYGR